MPVGIRRQADISQPVDTPHTEVVDMQVSAFISAFRYSFPIFTMLLTTITRR